MGIRILLWVHWCTTYTLSLSIMGPRRRHTMTNELKPLELNARFWQLNLFYNPFIYIKCNKVYFLLFNIEYTLLDESWILLGLPSHLPPRQPASFLVDVADGARLPAALPVPRKHVIAYPYVTASPPLIFTKAYFFISWNPIINQCSHDCAQQYKLYSTDIGFSKNWLKTLLHWDCDFRLRPMQCLKN